MKKIIIGMILLTLLVACGNNNQNPKTQVNPYISGNAAMNMYLQEGLPPPEVYDYQYKFSVGAVIENVGEYNIQPDDFFEVRLENLQATLFGKDPTLDPFVIDRDIPLNGQKRNPLDGATIPGQIDHVIFEDLEYQSTIQGFQIFPFRIHACYDYENYATAVLCFKKDTIENAQDASLCTLNGDKPVYNSAGPLHVTALRENSMGQPYKISTTLVFEHVGTGEFYDPIDGESCDTSVTNPNKYKADIELSIDGPGIIDCPGLENGDSGTLTFFQGSPRTLTCTITGTDEGTPIYTSSLNVKIRYRYGEFIEDQFTVRHIPRPENPQ